MAVPPNQKPDDVPLVVELDDEKPSPTLTVRGVGEKRTLADWLVIAGIPAALVVVFAVVLVLWLKAAGTTSVEQRLPQAAPPPSATASQPADGQLPGTSAVTPEATATLPTGTPPTAGGSASSVPASGAPAPTGGGPAAALSSSGRNWPGFRGPKRDGVSPERGLARSWPSGGPQRLWTRSFDEGHAGAAVWGDRVFLLEYDLAARADKLICMSLSNGQEIWRQSYPSFMKNNHGLSRTVPAADGKYVVSLGPLGMVMCCEAATGKIVWKHDLVKEYGTVIPEWYAGQCPLIENNNTIIAPGGKAIMVAFHLPTGKPTWTAPNPRGWQMTHSSITPISYAGKRIYVYPASGGVVGVNSADGKILWSTPDWTVNTSNIPAPINIGDGRIFLCGGYNSGAMMLKMNGSGTGVSQVFRLGPNVFQSHQQTPILYQSHLYGVKAPSGEMVCMDLSGKIVWASGTVRFALGPYTLADGMLYVLSESGQLSMVPASPTGFKQIASAKVLSSPPAWAPMALSDGKLLCRDARTLVCLKVK